jgi:23S rRNA (uridine2552-2'-O)-methyltransferase
LRSVVEFNRLTVVAHSDFRASVDEAACDGCGDCIARCHFDALSAPEGMCVVDLGAAPGSWSQVARERVGPDGRVIALDVLAMQPIEGVEFIHGDFTEDEALAELEAMLGDMRPDLVLSDMAPNISGVSAVDQPRAMYLSELALAFAEQWLKPGGDFLCKVFQGEGFDRFLKQCRSGFRKVLVRKPKASRPRSREVYVLGRGRKLL